jgi:hypothetical protein
MWLAVRNCAHLSVGWAKKYFPYRVCIYLYIKDMETGAAGDRNRSHHCFQNINLVAKLHGDGRLELGTLTTSRRDEVQRPFKPYQYGVHIEH